MSQTAKHVIFAGQVQGVGFRFTAHRIAGRYGLSGWVRNLRDGTVEMFAQGSSEDIDGCIRDIEESFGGYVTETRVQEAAIEPDRRDFRITF